MVKRVHPSLRHGANTPREQGVKRASRPPIVVHCPAMSTQEDKPVIVQSDRSILLETDGPRFEDARDALAAFAELVKSPEHIHTYRITPLSLWNAAAAGMTDEQIIASLYEFSKYEVPDNILVEIRDCVSRYGRLKMYKETDGPLVIESDDSLLIMELLNHKDLQEYVQGTPDQKRILVDTPSHRKET